jgi:hypothetical protein
VARGAAAKHLYGEYDRCSTKQVFDNLHGNISLDPVSGWLPRAYSAPSYPLSSPPPLPLAAVGVVVAAVVLLRRLVGLFGGSVSADLDLAVGHWTAPRLVLIARCVFVWFSPIFS